MHFDLWWLSYLALGACVGFFAGLLGVGGGSIIVPILTTLFVAQRFPMETALHMALGTSLATIVLTSVSSMRAHNKLGAVRWDIVKMITPGILLGTFGGSFLASRIPPKPLAIFFALFMSYVAFSMLANVKSKPSRALPGPFGTSLVGLAIGGFSALVAIGGGSLSVPFMTWCNVKVHQAIGTSAAIGLPIALAGTLGYLVTGWGSSGMPAYSLGFIYLPALVLISVVSVFVAPLGARLAHRLPVTTLKKIFAFVLLLLCAKMLQTVFG